MRTSTERVLASLKESDELLANVKEEADKLGAVVKSLAEEGRKHLDSHESWLAEHDERFKQERIQRRQTQEQLQLLATTNDESDGKRCVSPRTARVNKVATEFHSLFPNLLNGAHSDKDTTPVNVESDGKRSVSPGTARFNKVMTEFQSLLPNLLNGAHQEAPLDDHSSPSLPLK